MQKEIWKDIPNYEGYYQASNLGRIKSLDRSITYSDGRVYNMKSTILNPLNDGMGYLKVSLSKDTKSKHYRIHQLVSIAFLNHKPNGYKLVCNHINFNKHDNRVENLEIVTQRENTNQKHLKSSSQYTGVRKYNNKWRSDIVINGKKKHLGYFTNEYDAHLAYERELNNVIINN